MLNLKDTNQLKELKEKSDSFFFITEKKKKQDGTVRIIYDVKHELKSVHRKITRKLLRKVNYPDYLKGSLPKRDYLDNANAHTSSKCIITEDIKNFFPSIRKDIVISIWKNIFHFPHDVAETLAELITYKGYLVQGCVASSYIANLALWYKEPELVKELHERGFTYTRYVDDISVSSKRIITRKEKSEIVRKIHIILSSIGVKLNRKKHKIMPRNENQKIHRINLNTKNPTLPKNERRKIESAVYQCEQMFNSSSNSQEYENLFNSTLGRVNMLSRLHNSLAAKLKCRLEKIKPIKKHDVASVLACASHLKVQSENPKNFEY